MAIVRVTIELPFRLRLVEGNYSTPEPNRFIYIRGYRPSLDGPPVTYRGNTLIWATFEASDHPMPDDAQKLKAEHADRLLRAVNLLLQLYRFCTGDSDIVELTRAQISPFKFTYDQNATPWTDEHILNFEVSPLKFRRKISNLSEVIKQHLTVNFIPPVETLLLFDAEQAARLGRYREAVLLCWSAIDGSFNRKYDRLVESRLSDELRSARDFFMGVDFGIKNKMTAGLYLICGTSLFRQLGQDWEQLSNSYTKRNNVIHRGDIATMEDAENAIAVAQRIVEILNNIPDPM